MADSGSSIPETKSEEVPKRACKISMLILSFILKCISTCCELVKTVKFHPKAIQNPREVTVDVQVDSKSEGKWTAKYQASDIKVGSLSDGTDTVSYDETEKSVANFLSYLMKRSAVKVQYLALDCDTMHVIGDVTITQDHSEGSGTGDIRAETNQDGGNLKVESNQDIRDIKNEAGDNEEWDENLEVTIYKRNTWEFQNEGVAKKNEDNNTRQSTGAANDDNSRFNEDRVVNDKAKDAQIGKGTFHKVKAARKRNQIKIWLIRATYWPMFEEEPEDRKLEVSAELSKNPGYCRLKLNRSQPMAHKRHNQILFLCKSNESGYLKKPKPNIVKDLATCYAKEHDFKPDVAIMVNEPKYKILMFLSCQGQMGSQNYSETKDTFMAVGLDWVLCLKMKQWPKEAEEWIARDRKSNWPGWELIVEVVKAGCHLVPKAHPNNQADATEWRISFSEAERILFMHLSEIQKTCFRMFKMVTQLHCKVITDDKEEYPSSYALKTIFLWACDEIAPTDWEQNLGYCFLGLFDKLAEALEDKTIKGYFIPEMNLIGHIDSKLIYEYLVIVNEIIQDPIKYLKETWKAIIEPKLGWTFDRIFGDLIRCADKSDEDQDIAMSKTYLNLALMINDYLCQGAVVRNSFKTKMAQQVYDRQGSSTAEMKMIGNEVEEKVHVTEADDSGLHNVKELLEKCQDLSRKYTTNPAVHFGILPQAYILAGEIDYMLGRLQEAKKNFEKAIEILTKKGCQVAPGAMSGVHTKYAKCLEDQNAIQQYDKALKLDPFNTEAQVYKVMLLYRTGQKEVLEQSIKDICSSQTENSNMIQLSRGDLRLLDKVLCSEVRALLNWSVKFPKVPYGMKSEAVLIVFVPETVILSHLYMKGQNITKATLNKELRFWVNLMEEAGKMGRADCQYISNSLLGMMHYDVRNYWDALKLLRNQIKTDHCSETVKARWDMLMTIFKITIGE